MLFFSTLVPEFRPPRPEERELPPSRGTIRSGVALLDEWLGGLRAGRPHLLTGGPGTGKSTIALHFVEAGLRRGESVAVLTNAQPADVKTLAEYLGIDLRKPLTDGRLLLFRYRSDFAYRAARAVAPERVVEELQRTIAPHRPARIVIDSFAPLVAGQPPVGPVVSALAELLEESGACSVLTFPEDLSAGYDRNLEPIVQSAAALIRLTREEGETRRAELLSIRYPSNGQPIARFAIRERALVSDGRARAERISQAVS